MYVHTASLTLYACVCVYTLVGVVVVDYRYAKMQGKEFEGQLIFRLGTLFMLQNIDKGIDRDVLAGGDDHLNVFKVQHGVTTLILQANSKKEQEKWVSRCFPPSHALPLH
jgi:hypothetical protein